MTWLRVVLVAGACAGGLQAADVPAQPAPSRAFEIAHTVVGSEATGNAAAAAYLASRLDARPGCAAAMIDARSAGAWDQRSAAGGPCRVSLVQAAFANWNDWLALVFDGPGGALTSVARRPAKRQPRDGFFTGMESILPGREQADRNAVIELAGDFYHGLANRSGQPPRPLVHVRVTPQAEPAGSGGDSDFLRSAQAGLMTGPSKAELEGIRALAMAALSRSGWWPTAGEAPQSLELFVERQPDRYAVQARYTSPKGLLESNKHDLYPATLHDGLVRLLNRLIPARTPGVDFAAVDTRGVVPVGTHENLLMAAQGSTLHAFDMVTGLRAWTLSSPEKQRYRFMALTSAGVGGVVLVHSPGLQVLDQTDGRDGSMQSFAGTPYPWGIDASAAQWVKVAARGAGHASHRNHDINVTGWLMVASGRRLIAYEKAVARWEYSGPSVLTAGPCRLEDRVIVGGRDGTVTALRNADGAVAWTADLGERLAGPVVVAGPVVAVASLEGTLFGLNATDGRLLWKRELGDAAIAGPYSTARGLFVASGSSSLWLVDPANGQVKVRREWPAPLLAAVPLEKRNGFACSDSAGGVAFLDPATLQSLRHVNLNAPLTAGLLPVGDLPRRWGAQDDLMATRGPGVVVGDENGFVHLVAADEREELSVDKLDL
jgi:outer membrane protein assembly factor BamB